MQSHLEEKADFDNLYTDIPPFEFCLNEQRVDSPVKIYRYSNRGEYQITIAEKLFSDFIKQNLHNGIVITVLVALVCGEVKQIDIIYFFAVQIILAVCSDAFFVMNKCFIF